MNNKKQYRKVRKIDIGVHRLSLTSTLYCQQVPIWGPQNFPEATRIGRQTASLPLYSKPTDKHAKDVVREVCGVFRA